MRNQYFQKKQAIAVAAIIVLLLGVYLMLPDGRAAASPIVEWARASISSLTGVLGGYLVAFWVFNSALTSVEG